MPACHGVRHHHPTCRGRQGQRVVSCSHSYVMPYGTANARAIAGILGHADGTRLPELMLETYSSAAAFNRIKYHTIPLGLFGSIPSSLTTTLTALGMQASKVRSCAETLDVHAIHWLEKMYNHRQSVDAPHRPRPQNTKPQPTPQERIILSLQQN